jgi:ABC-type Fe3+ transport system substrate-binding protein
MKRLLTLFWLVSLSAFANAQQLDERLRALEGKLDQAASHIQQLTSILESLRSEIAILKGNKEEPLSTLKSTSMQEGIKADEFFRALKANDVKVVPGNSVVRDMVVRGEVKVGLTDTDDVNVALENKQPVAMVFPDREGIGVPVMPNMVSLIAGAPHPEAGKRLIDYLLSQEVERMLAESEAVQIPLHGGVEGPKNIPPLNSFKPMTLDYGKAAGRVEDVTRRLQPILGL